MRVGHRSFDRTLLMDALIFLFTPSIRGSLHPRRSAVKQDEPPLRLINWEGRLPCTVRGISHSCRKYAIRPTFDSLSGIASISTAQAIRTRRKTDGIEVHHKSDGVYVSSYAAPRPSTTRRRIRRWRSPTVIAAALSAASCANCSLAFCPNVIGEDAL